MRFLIPKQHYPHLANLVTASDSDIAGLSNALAATPPTADLQSAISKKVDGPIGTSKPAEILDVLVSLRLLWDSLAPIQIDAFAADICESMEATGDKDLKKPEDGWGRFKANLSRLLSHDGLWMAAKAAELFHGGHEQTYCRSRIFTDARPMFRADLSAGPVAFAIVHTLQITVHKGEGDKELSIALRAGELRKLRDVIDRALSKETALRATLSKSEAPALATSEE